MPTLVHTPLTKREHIRRLKCPECDKGFSEEEYDASIVINQAAYHRDCAPIEHVTSIDRGPEVKGAELPKRIWVKPDGYTKMLLWQLEHFEGSAEYVPQGEYQALFDWIMGVFWRLFPHEVETSIERAQEKIEEELGLRWEGHID